MGIKTEHMYVESVYAWMVITYDRLLIWKEEPDLPSNPAKYASIRWPEWIDVADTKTKPPDGNNQLKVGPDPDPLHTLNASFSKHQRPMGVCLRFTRPFPLSSQFTTRRFASPSCSGDTVLLASPGIFLLHETRTRLLVSAHYAASLGGGCACAGRAGHATN